MRIRRLCHGLHSVASCNMLSRPNKIEPPTNCVSKGVFRRRLIRAVIFRFWKRERERERERKKEKKRERARSRRDEGSSCRRGTGCAYNITVAFGGSKMTALPSRTLRRGVTAVTTVAVASACTQKKRLTPYLAAVAEETPPPRSTQGKSRPSRIYCE